jgi:hypothetical protein
MIVKQTNPRAPIIGILGALGLQKTNGKCKDGINLIPHMEYLIQEIVFVLYES